MNQAKIRLSATEMELVQNADIILTKNVILQKVQQLLGRTATAQQYFLQQHSDRWPGAVTNTSPKISKGENYRGLPYMVLDYPRLFEKGSIMAVRTMFWWGHFFSITLQLSGSYKTLYTEAVSNEYAVWCENGFYYCINEDPWEHHFEEENYRPVVTLSHHQFAGLLREKPFIKLARKIPLHQWDDADSLLPDAFRLIMEKLSG